MQFGWLLLISYIVFGISIVHSRPTTSPSVDVNPNEALILELFLTTVETLVNHAVRSRDLNKQWNAAWNAVPPQHEQDDQVEDISTEETEEFTTQVFVSEEDPVNHKEAVLKRQARQVPPFGGVDPFGLQQQFANVGQQQIGQFGQQIGNLLGGIGQQLGPGLNGQQLTGIDPLASSFLGGSGQQLAAALGGQQLGGLDPFTASLLGGAAGLGGLGGQQFGNGLGNQQLGGLGSGLLSSLGLFGGLGSGNGASSDLVGNVAQGLGFGPVLRIAGLVNAIDKHGCLRRTICETVAGRNLTAFTSNNSTRTGLDLPNVNQFLDFMRALQFSDNAMFPYFEAAALGHSHRDPERCRRNSKCPSTTDAVIQGLNETPGGLQGAISNLGSIITNATGVSGLPIPGIPGTGGANNPPTTGTGAGGIDNLFGLGPLGGFLGFPGAGTGTGGTGGAGGAVTQQPLLPLPPQSGFFDPLTGTFTPAGTGTGLPDSSFLQQPGAGFGPIFQPGGQNVGSFVPPLGGPAFDPNFDPSGNFNDPGLNTLTLKREANRFDGFRDRVPKSLLAHGTVGANRFHEFGTPVSTSSSSQRRGVSGWIWPA